MANKSSSQQCKTRYPCQSRCAQCLKSLRKVLCTLCTIAPGLLVFGTALVVGLYLVEFAFANFGWGRTSVLLLTYLVGVISGEAKDVASRSCPSGKVWRDMWCAFKKAWGNERSATFAYRSLEWGALTGAALVLSQMLAPQMPMGGD